MSKTSKDEKIRVGEIKNEKIQSSNARNFHVNDECIRFCFTR